MKPILASCKVLSSTTLLMYYEVVVLTIHIVAIRI
jgi:hypothetical protein